MSDEDPVSPKAIAAVPSPVSAIVVLAMKVVGPAVFGWRATGRNRVSTSDLMVLRSRDQNPNRDGTDG